MIKYLIKFLKSRTLNFSFKGILSALFSSKAKFLKKTDLLILCHDNSRTAVVDGLRYAPIVDVIADDLGPEYKSITFSLPFSKYFGKECYGNTIMYNRTILFAYLKRLVFYGKLSLAAVDKDPLIKAWSKILKKTAPRAIIGVNPSIEVCIVAREMGIWVADVQHGILAPFNYYGIKKRMLIDQRGWPDAILCWDNFSQQYINNNLLGLVKPIVIGHPAYCSRTGQRLFGQAQKSIGNEINVLVTLDSLCPDSLDNDPIYKRIGIPEGLYQYIKEKGQFCNWKIRLHPAQLQRKKQLIYEELADLFKGCSNVEWDICSVNPLPTILPKMHAHITYNSAATREASLFNVKTIIMDQDINAIEAYFGDLIKHNTIEMIPAMEWGKITSWINECYTLKCQLKKIDTSEDLDLKSNFSKFIKSLKDKLDGIKTEFEN